MKPVTSVVRSYQCDSYQHMNNARYLEVLEDARWAFLEPVIKEGYFERNHLIFLVVNINISYKYPAVPHDILETSVMLASYGRASMTVKQVVFNKTQEKVSAEAEVTFVLFDTEKGRSASVSDEIKEIFNKLDGEG